VDLPSGNDQIARELKTIESAGNAANAENEESGLRLEERKLGRMSE
jgi:hypothetical protein